MKTIAVLSAMSKELDQIKEMGTLINEKNINDMRVLEEEVAGKRVVFSQSGMGKVCAATNTIEMIREYKPDLIINSGCAGSLAKDVDIKDAVIATEIAYHDVWYWEPNVYGQVQGFPPTFKTNEKILKKVQKIVEDESNLHYGLVCTGDKFVSSERDIKDVLSHFPQSLAVDMEAAAIAQVCYMYKTDLLSIKIISDNPVRYKDGFAQYNTFWSDMADASFKIVSKIIKEL